MNKYPYHIEAARQAYVQKCVGNWQGPIKVKGIKWARMQKLLRYSMRAESFLNMLKRA